MTADSEQNAKSLSKVCNHTLYCRFKNSEIFKKLQDVRRHDECNKQTKYTSIYFFSKFYIKLPDKKLSTSISETCG